MLAGLEKTVPGLLQTHRVSGIAVAAFDQGCLSINSAYGVSERPIRTPLRADSCFCLAALTMPFTARLALDLVDSGELDLDKPLFEYVPLDRIVESPWWQSVTARTVLSHSTGMPFRTSDSGELPSLAFEPGTRFQYSNQAFNYLQMVVENVTRAPLASFARRKLLEPIGMSNSGFSGNELGHVHWAGSLPEPVVRRFWASGGLWSTAADYGNFVLSVLNGDGLSPALHRETFELQIDTGLGAGWGLGWGLCESHGDKHIFHFGSAGSYRNYVQANTATNDIAVILTNSKQGIEVCRHVIETDCGWRFPRELIEDFFGRVSVSKT